MIRSTLKMLALLASFSFVAACGGDDGGGLDCEDPATVTASMRGAMLISSSCQSCHASSVPVADRGGAPENITFDDAADITANEARIRARAIDKDPAAMPPPAAGTLSAAQISDLETYLDCR